MEKGVSIIYIDCFNVKLGFRSQPVTVRAASGSSLTPLAQPVETVEIGTEAAVDEDGYSDAIRIGFGSDFK